MEKLIFRRSFLRKKERRPGLRSFKITTETEIRFSSDGNEISNIEIDSDGDGEVDIELSPAGELIESEVEEEVTYETLRQEIIGLRLPAKYEKSLLRKVRIAEKMSQKQTGKVTKKLERLFLLRLEKQLEWLVRKDKVEEETAEEIIEIIEEIREK